MAHHFDYISNAQGIVGVVERYSTYMMKTEWVKRKRNPLIRTDQIGSISFLNESHQSAIRLPKNERRISRLK